MNLDSRMVDIYANWTGLDWIWKEMVGHFGGLWGVVVWFSLYGIGRRMDGREALFFSFITASERC